MDENGYPTEQELSDIKNFPINNKKDCKRLLAAVKEIWWAVDWG